MPTRYVPFLGVLAALSMLLVLLVYYVFANYRREQHFMEEALNREGQAFLQALEAGTRVGLGGSRWEAAQFSRLLKELVQHPDVLYIQVLDAAGRSLMSAGPLPPASSVTGRSFQPQEMTTWMTEDETVFAVAKRFQPLGTAASTGPAMQQWRAWCRMMGVAPTSTAQYAVVGLSTAHFPGLPSTTVPRPTTFRS